MAHSSALQRNYPCAFAFSLSATYLPHQEIWIGEDMTTILVAILVIIFIHFICSGNSVSSGSGSGHFSEWFEPPEKRVGRRGEEKATQMISQLLTPDDHLLTNVQISAEGKAAELDNVIVNQYGIFIIEVKNYNGRLIGEIDDYEWQKYHTTDAGNTYCKTVKNPIKQVNRQVYVLHKYLEHHGIHAWVNGYTILLYNNSPVKSAQILTCAKDIQAAVHTPGRTRLSQKEIRSIVELLRS